MRVSNIKEVHMSWYKKSPVKHPPKPKPQTPHKPIPSTETAMQEAKKTGPKNENR